MTALSDRRLWGNMFCPRTAWSFVWPIGSHIGDTAVSLFGAHTHHSGPRSGGAPWRRSGTHWRQMCTGGDWEGWALKGGVTVVGSSVGVSTTPPPPSPPQPLPLTLRIFHQGSPPERGASGRADPLIPPLWGAGWGRQPFSLAQVQPKWPRVPCLAPLPTSQGVPGRGCAGAAAAAVATTSRSCGAFRRQSSPLCRTGRV